MKSIVLYIVTMIRGAKDSNLLVVDCQQFHIMLENFC